MPSRSRRQSAGAVFAWALSGTAIVLLLAILVAYAARQPAQASNVPFVYIGGTPGQTGGFAYYTQTPTLPFAARWHIHWAADDNSTLAYESNGTTWADDGWNFLGDVYRSGTFVEMRIPRADIGAPSTLRLHLSMINTTALNEYTFAGVPSTSFTDAFNPPLYQHYFEFDLTGSQAPNTYSPQ